MILPTRDKMEAVMKQSEFANLNEQDQAAVRAGALKHRFTYQELKQIIDMFLDFEMWGEPSIREIFRKKSGKVAFEAVKKAWWELKKTPKSYDGFSGSPEPTREAGTNPVAIEGGQLGFGACPVASEDTRCCNLLTLDAAEGCGFDCTYCSIRYFYNPKAVEIDKNFARKLESLELDPHRTYHIGTGQASDSLMWGNKWGLLDSLLDFAECHPNVILELKTKSDNVNHIISRKIPANVISTWSLNTDTIIDNEEHFTASLSRRLAAATEVSEKGGLIGFHIHPMLHYDRWQEEYGALFTQIQEHFVPKDVVLVSLGTLTFTKRVIRGIRGRKMQSKVLQMPLVKAASKYSYPLDIKKEMFRFAYEAFSEWHKHVFFYLCMEDIVLWPSVFGYEYTSNEDFEAAMISHYLNKIESRGGQRCSRRIPD